MLTHLLLVKKLFIVTRNKNVNVNVFTKLLQDLGVKIEKIIKFISKPGSVKRHRDYQLPLLDRDSPSVALDHQTHHHILLILQHRAAEQLKCSVTVQARI